MTTQVEAHYGTGRDLAARIAESLKAAGKDIAGLTPEDLATVDEFHVRGRKATLELVSRMQLSPAARVLDIGSGLGGPARTVAAATGAHVTGIDLTESFCAAAAEMSRWVGLADRVTFRQGDATQLPFGDASFDAAMTIHVAMNIPAKDAVYAEARRVVKPGGIFAVYDILQGEGGPVLFPVPWAREPSISHLASPAQMRRLLGAAGFTLLDEIDSSAESLAWFQAMAARLQAAAPPVSFQVFLGPDFPAMAQNQVRNLGEDRIRTVTFICRA